MTAQFFIERDNASGKQLLLNTSSVSPEARSGMASPLQITPQKSFPRQEEHHTQEEPCRRFNLPPIHPPLLSTQEEERRGCLPQCSASVSPLLLKCWWLSLKQSKQAHSTPSPPQSQSPVLGTVHPLEILITKACVQLIGHILSTVSFLPTRVA